MKNLILVFLAMGSVLIFFSCQEESALAPELGQSNQVVNSLAKPLPNLIGEMKLKFTFVHPYFWVGTIDFGDGNKYSMRFETLSDLRGYSQASPFEENFIIYKFETNWTNPDNVYLAGHDEGVTTLANKPPDPCKYRMNGKIDVANVPFEEWLGRNVHMSGVITWQGSAPPYAPDTADGKFRIN